jgi:hypothetical protein
LEGTVRRGAAIIVFLLALLPRMAAADLQFDPRSTPADAQRLRDLVAKCQGELDSFRELMDAIHNSSRAVPVWPGRDQPGVFVDGFNSGQIDLSDLEKYVNPRKDPETGKWVFPPGTEDAATLCENLAHVLYERFHANYVGGQYAPSHDAANGYESRIRHEFGQTGNLIECTGDGRTDDAISIYADSTFIIERDVITLQPNGSRDVGPITTKRVKTVCIAICQPPRPRPMVRLYAGADTCTDCETDLQNQCGGVPGRITGSTCRSK